jgi:CMP-N,N'-diacetyllegionaminic acid synthase
VSAAGGGKGVALILARGGSKGVPNKNVLPVAGKACILWTIDAARAAKSVGVVVVSTDGEAIAAAAKGAGVRGAEPAGGTGE